MIDCAFFPTIPSTLPILRHIIRGNAVYRITTLLSFAGSGMEELDGSVADCRKPLNLLIQEDISKDCDKWERLLVVGYQNEQNEEENNRYTVQLMLTALKLHKSVTCAKRLAPEVYETCTRIAAENSVCFEYLPNASSPIKVKNKGALRRLHSFYVLFGGIIRDSTSLDSCYLCAEQLSKNYSTLIMSTEESPLVCGGRSLYPIIHSGFSETEKIYAINQCLADIERDSHAEIVFLHVAEPVLAFDDNDPNEFGIMPFMLSKALPTNLFICNIPFSYYTPEFVKSLSDGILHQNGYPIDGVSITNLLVDYTSVSVGEHVSTVYVPGELVDTCNWRSETGDGIPVYNLMNDEDRVRSGSYIEEAYLQFVSTRIIP